MLQRPASSRFLTPLLALTLAAWSCSSSPAKGQPDATEVTAEEATPEAETGEAVEKDAPGEGAAEEAHVNPWELTLEPAGQATVDAHLGFEVLGRDEEAGTFTVRLSSGAIAGLFGLSFHLGWDPQVLEVTEITKLFPSDLGDKAWAVAARADQDRGRVVGGVVVLRGKDPFGQNPPPEYDLPTGTALLEATFRVLKAGDTALKLGFPDTLALDAQYAPLALETIDLKVSAQTNGGEQ